MEITKDQSSQLSNQRKVPELNINSYINGGSSEKAKFSDSLFSGLKEYGFIILTGHPISEDLLNKAYEYSQKLFSLDMEIKQKYSLKDNGFQRGYTPFGVEHAKDSKVADLKEFWHIGRALSKDHKAYDKSLENIWLDEELPEFKTVFLSIYEKLDQVGLVMLEALTKPLDLPKTYFKERVASGNSILRLLHYPPVAEGVEKSALRAAPHEDINLITILVAATTSGLQLKDRDGEWLDVEAPKNSLIVDAGDMLARITNDVIPSTTHQVINPKEAENKSRYSMPFFIHPNSDAMLECIPSCAGESGEKYPKINADVFLKQRLKDIGLIK